MDPGDIPQMGDLFDGLTPSTEGCGGAAPAGRHHLVTIEGIDSIIHGVEPVR